MIIMSMDFLERLAKARGVPLYVILDEIIEFKLRKINKK
jgi:hypothetical protein